MNLRRFKMMRAAIVGGVLGLAAGATAQPYSITWYTVDGGGHGPITGGAYSLQGTIGQPDASGALTGGSFSIVGGYWAGLLPSTPTVSNPASSGVSITTATVSADVTSDGGSTITERGFVFSVNSTNPDPLIAGTGVTKVPVAGTVGAFSTGLTSLAPNTQYAFKGFATNSVGTTYTVVSTFQTLAAPAGGGNTSAATARAITLNSTAADILSSVRNEVWYRIRLFANRSYQVSAKTLGEDGAAGVTPVSVTIFSDAAGTILATPAPTTLSTSLEGSPNDSEMFAQSSLFEPAATAVYRIRVQGAPSATNTSLNVMARETTMFSPWTSRAAGFEGFIEIHNNTSAPVDVTLSAYDSAGVLQGTALTVSVPANATVFKTATQTGVPVNVFAGIVLRHNGAFGAISGNITTLNGANGLSFDSPFTSRAGGLQGLPVR